jgi:hypothetical protein
MTLGNAQLILDLNDLESVHAFVRSAVVVVGPPALHALVALHWPELLHKVKPPATKIH